MIKVDLEKVAKTIVHDSMKLKENDVLWIEAGVHNLDLAEAVGVELRKIGGFPIIEVTSDKYQKKIFEETSEEFLGKPQKFRGEMYGKIDALLYIENEKDPKNREHIPASKKSAFRAAGMPWRTALRENKTKIALFLYPTPEMAEAYNVSWEEYHDRVWGAVQILPQDLYDIGKPIRDLLDKGNDVHITSKKGTDLRFSIKGRKGLICNGEEVEENYKVCRYNLNIPAGEVFTTIVEDSANGVAVFDKVYVDGTPVTDLKLTFRDGSAVAFEAKENEDKFAEYYETLTPADKLSAEFGIGTNEYVKDVIGCLHTDEKIAGTIHIAIGASIMYGGENDAPVHFDMIMPEPTVTIDGDYMMKDGKMVF